MQFRLSQLCLALALGGLTLAVNAQQAGTQSAGTSPSARSGAASSGAAHAPSSKAAKSTTTGKATKQRSATHTNQARSTGGRAQTAAAAPDSPYKAALRRCVTGPESSRDACIDQAIAQYGHA